METKTKPTARNFNKYAYAVFAVVGVIFFLVKDYGQSVIFIGLALVFDPFNQTISFDKRPLWQRVWLIVHVMVAFAAISVMFWKQ